MPPYTTDVTLKSTKEQFQLHALCGNRNRYSEGMQYALPVTDVASFFFSISNPPTHSFVLTPITIYSHPYTTPPKKIVSIHCTYTLSCGPLSLRRRQNVQFPCWVKSGDNDNLTWRNQSLFMYTLTTHHIFSKTYGAVHKICHEYLLHECQFHSRKSHATACLTVLHGNMNDIYFVTGTDYIIQPFYVLI